MSKMFLRLVAAVLMPAVLLVSVDVSAFGLKAPDETSGRAIPRTREGLKMAMDSPCNDSLYVELKARPLDGLSEREYEYFIQRDRECSAYQRARMQSEASAEPQRRMAKSVENATNTYVTIAILGVLLSVVAYVVFVNRVDDEAGL